MAIKEVSAPLPGTFYRKPDPEQPEFVKDGDQIKVGDVVCIIEVMKMFNKVTSEEEGKIVRFLVEDGDPVMAGQALYELETG